MSMIIFLVSIQFSSSVSVFLVIILTSFMLDVVLFLIYGVISNNFMSLIPFIVLLTIPMFFSSVFASSLLLFVYTIKVDRGDGYE